MGREQYNHIKMLEKIVEGLNYLEENPHGRYILTGLSESEMNFIKENNLSNYKTEITDSKRLKEDYRFEISKKVKE